MSATRDENSTKSVSNQEGQFASHVPPSEPLTTHGHKPGVIASAADAAPEFSAQTLPPGTAPKSNTFTPNPDTVDPSSTAASASESLGGSTSADVHTGLGHPGSGQTSSELHHDGQHGRKKQTHGLEGVGATGGDSINAHDPAFAEQRALDKDEAQVGEGLSLTGKRGNTGGPPAEEMFPEGAERVAAEAPRN